MVQDQPKLIGKVSHYYNRIGVATVDLIDDLKEGDTVRIIGTAADFIQDVKSMELEYKRTNSAPAGSSVGMKVDQRVGRGYRIYKI